VKRLAIIPARGGSKRIPKKNSKPFLGKPIIAYSIECALESNLFDEVMVSTDNVEIAEIAKKNGANVPFFRTSENANDFATLSDVIKEVLNDYETHAKKFDQYCCILPTAPFLTPEHIQKAFHLLTDKNYKTVFPVVRFSYPIQRALQLDKEQNITMIYPENLTARSQDLSPSFHDAGQFYCGVVDSFKTEQQLFTDFSGSIELTELEVQDIDTEEDWKIAEIKYEFLQSDK